MFRLNKKKENITFNVHNDFKQIFQKGKALTLNMYLMR